MWVRVRVSPEISEMHTTSEEEWDAYSPTFKSDVVPFIHIQQGEQTRRAEQRAEARLKLREGWKRHGTRNLLHILVLDCIAAKPFTFPSGEVVALSHA